MTVQYSGAVRDAKQNAIETTVGTAPLLQLRSGAPPANTAAAASGTLLAEDPLPSDWMGASSGGVKAKAGTWTLTGEAAGNIGHFRIYDSTGTTCHMQGTVTATGGGGDMTVDNVAIGVGQEVTVNTFSLTAGNA